MSTVPPPLGQGAGYGVLVGLGVAFAVGMVLVTRALKRTFGEDNSSTETFMVANRSVGTGLTASAVISSWLYSTALLGAPYLTYWYGIALPLFWANGQSVMICAFAWMAISAKRRVPNAHTLLELIRARYGSIAHITWIVMCIINNLLIFSSMLVGASASVTALTGMNMIAATYLLPLGVVIYTYFGGLRATFLTDYIHTFVIMVVLVWFTIKILAVKEIGSVGALYDVMVQAGKDYPVDGNLEGSYLTMTSEQSIYFGIIHVLSNFGVVFLDTGFWQKGFAADVSAAVPGYILGGNAYFAIPFCFGTVMGLGALALERSPAFPTYPQRMTAAEVSSGLVLPYTSQALAGKGGAAAVLIIVFMACTSITSAQLIAMSSIFSFDIYGTYINKQATNTQIIRMSHVGVLGSWLIISTLATAFHEGGVDLNWLLYMLGILICPGFFPTAFALVWKRQTKAAAITAPLTGMACGLIVWTVTARQMYGSTSIANLGKTLPCLYATVTSAFVPLPITIAISIIWPNPDFEWSDLLSIKRVQDDEHGKVSANASHFDAATYFSPEKVAYMKRMARIAVYWGAFTFIAQWVLWPLPMYGARFIFSKGLFTTWVVVGIVWLWVALFVSSFYPLIDGGWRKIIAVVRGREVSAAEDASDVALPPAFDGDGADNGKQKVIEVGAKDLSS
ncbi:SSS family solute:Na+ symporter [Teratosphaeria destructans]|uniref:SSS family solute:Na+ symporter n=1 Tax=Teratosphaeria destructans TaxID=418781 RepID=A0A9W7SRD0_9PEZI|nr:SSS family solute:Na+ symporter [Teratosphaeria destructans]